jgi:periplasmic divalent cation tolerance protein
MSKGEFLIVLCTCPNPEVAEKLARTLVEKELSACVNIIPSLTSIYRWQGEICQEQEVLLIIKTVKHLFPELEETIKRKHPYEVPEIIAIPVAEGSEAYLSWLKALGK